MKTPILILAVIAIAILGYFYYPPKENENSDGIFCAMDVKLCPDGSYVGRTGPKCEFALCPNEGAGNGGGGILPYKSGISGVVLRGPMCPVMREPPDPNCADAPYETEVILSRASAPAKTFATIRSGKDGKFLINLPPGDYIVNAKNDGISKICSPISVSVGDGVENVSISCDTGIR